MQAVIPQFESSVAVVIPCYKVRSHVLDVIAAIGPEVTRIYAVDDACPDQSGTLIEEECSDPRVTVLRHQENKGVGGAVMTGYRAAVADGAEVIVKLDGDGQMDPGLLLTIARPVLEGWADYAKGNRFYSVWFVRKMPRARLWGNAGLSFLTKLSSGYWSVFDPTNGYTAIHRTAIERLEFANISERYFFETDMLINLGNVRAVVADVPMKAVYGDEVSSLHAGRELVSFFGKHVKEIFKRILYTYFMRDFSLVSIELFFGLIMLLFGIGFGGWHWYLSLSTGVVASTGTVMVAVLPIILGFQLILNFLAYDMANEPDRPLQPTGSIAPAGQRIAVMREERSPGSKQG